jgi:hypothetical protein
MAQLLDPPVDTVVMMPQTSFRLTVVVSIVGGLVDLLVDGFHLVGTGRRHAPARRGRLEVIQPREDAPFELLLQEPRDGRRHDERHHDGEHERTSGEQAKPYLHGHTNDERDHAREDADHLRKAFALLSLTRLGLPEQIAHTCVVEIERAVAMTDCAYRVGRLSMATEDAAESGAWIEWLCRRMMRSMSAGKRCGCVRSTIPRVPHDIRRRNRGRRWSAPADGTRFDKFGDQRDGGDDRHKGSKEQQDPRNHRHVRLANRSC